MGSGAGEQRGLTLAVIDVRGVALRVYNTHLHTTEADRLLQTPAIARTIEGVREPSVVVGDFNARPTTREIEPIVARLTDAWAKAGVRGGDNPDGLTSPAEPGRNPANRIDYAFVSPAVGVRAARVVVDERTRMASDHYPLVVDLTLRAAQPKP